MSSCSAILWLALQCQCGVSKAVAEPESRNDHVLGQRGGERGSFISFIGMTNVPKVEISTWTTGDKETMLEAVKESGLDFGKLADRIKTKRPGDCAAFADEIHKSLGQQFVRGLQEWSGKGKKGHLAVARLYERVLSSEFESDATELLMADPQNVFNASAKRGRGKEGAGRGGGRGKERGRTTTRVKQEDPVSSSSSSPSPAPTERPTKKSKAQGRARSSSSVLPSLPARQPKKRASSPPLREPSTRLGRPSKKAAAPAVPPSPSVAARRGRGGSRGGAGRGRGGRQGCPEVGRAGRGGRGGRRTKASDKVAAVEEAEAGRSGRSGRTSKKPEETEAAATTSRAAAQLVTEISPSLPAALSPSLAGSAVNKPSMTESEVGVSADSDSHPLTPEEPPSPSPSVELACESMTATSDLLAFLDGVKRPRQPAEPPSYPSEPLSFPPDVKYAITQAAAPPVKRHKAMPPNAAPAMVFQSQSPTAFAHLPTSPFSCVMPASLPMLQPQPPPPPPPQQQQQQPQMNATARVKVTVKSPYIGVSFRGGSFYATMKSGGVQTVTGPHRTELEAALSYDSMVRARAGGRKMRTNFNEDGSRALPKSKAVPPVGGSKSQEQSQDSLEASLLGLSSQPDSVAASLATPQYFGFSSQAAQEGGDDDDHDDYYCGDDEAPDCNDDWVSFG